MRNTLATSRGMGVAGRFGAGRGKWRHDRDEKLNGTVMRDDSIIDNLNQYGCTTPEILHYCNQTYESERTNFLNETHLVLTTVTCCTSFSCNNKVPY
uniref:Uncharacterized protein n=1 Tax=Sphaerodactylus townsendi TaxID=933632 RepID=A0ACB8EGZ9_9SAUR